MLSAPAKPLAAALLLAVAGGCTLIEDERAHSTVRHTFVQPPQRAGVCFARNAEAHSSALVAEVRPPDAGGNVEVIVRVKNGVTYATLALHPAGQRSEGTLTLMVTSPRGTRELVRALVEGC